ncbi:glycosyltransferase family 2 protein [Sulfuracidifex metallicus]|uniref:Glycosyltransferase n=1 Tax=Sulfuracidifex metallicus DSM 6482 = JCM 9184 TaxID=523847 RepID=A0A6A9QIM7_SULME|nr:glycosyltransferase family 2 protein [Sulfuracidifex metallicus]MUN28524.1 glycosyltransferase [Sulfuracidifex metallicus DSM 6482 = JCM 9184]WOE50939.1 glycosyltransferase family 2 protein [Sulfuracidifex metallicus DSM 6482 = JCM 9184]
MKISVVIPTLNSEKTIGATVKSALQFASEVIVVDSFSTDRTVEIAEKEGAKVFQVKGSRLIARIEGVKIAKGDYVVNLDSDMYFSENFKGFEEKVIALGEITVGKGIVHKLMSIDREMTHRKWADNLSVGNGSIIPRMYDRQLLLKAYEQIPENLRSKLDAFEDSVIYYNVMKLYKDGKVQFIPNAVYHGEDDSLWNFMRKWYKYGKNAKLLRGTEYERFIYERRTRPGLSLGEKVKLLPLMVIKGVPFALGYYL